MVQFASYLRRVLCKTRLIFPRINGPNVCTYPSQRLLGKQTYWNSTLLQLHRNKLHFSSNCQNEINRSFFVCFSNLFRDIYRSYLNYISCILYPSHCLIDLVFQHNMYLSNNTYCNFCKQLKHWNSLHK